MFNEKIKVAIKLFSHTRAQTSSCLSVSFFRKHVLNFSKHVFFFFFLMEPLNFKVIYLVSTNSLLYVQLGVMPCKKLFIK